MADAGDIVEIGGQKYRVKGNTYDTQLSPDDEAAFKEWKAKYAPNDSGEDYDLRGAFKDGLTPTLGQHGPDTYKKPNHPTFSVESKYAKDRPDLAGRWVDDAYVPPPGTTLTAERRAAIARAGDKVQELQGAPAPRQAPSQAQPTEVQMPMVTIAGKSYRMKEDPAAVTAERQKRIDDIFAADKAKDEAKSRAESGLNVPLLGKLNLPTAGGMIGAGLGSGAASIPLAAAGGALGEGADQLLRKAAGQEPTEGGSKMAAEGAIQGAAQGVGLGVGNLAGKVIAGVGPPAARAALFLAEKAGIPVTAEKLLDSPAAQWAAAFARKIPIVGGPFRSMEGKAGEAIEGAAGKAMQGLPAAQADLDFGREVKTNILDPVVDRNKAEVRQAYDTAKQLVDPAKDNVVARNLYSTALGIKRQLGLGLKAIQSKELSSVVDEIISTAGPQQTPAGRVWNKIPYEKLDQWKKDIADRAYSSNDPLFTPIRRQLESLRGAVKQDIASIRNPALQKAIGEADALHQEKVVPFMEGATRLNRLLRGDEQQVASMLAGKEGPQIIRDLKPHLDPQHLETLTGQAVGNIFAGARDTEGQLVGKKVASLARKATPLLTELRDKGYANDLVDLGNVMERAQRGAGRPGEQAFLHYVVPSLGAGIGGGVAVHGGLGAVSSMVLSHPGAIAGVVLPGSVISGLMATKPGVRLLLNGLSGGRISAEAGRVGGKALGAAIGGALGSAYDPLKQFTDTVTKHSPIVQKQVIVQQKGPEGQPAIAQIGGRQSVYDPLIAASTQNSGVSPQLAKALFTTESAMNPKATSPKGAQGIAQFMPKTAQGVGLRDPYDPTEAIPAGVQHLGNLLQKYNGNKELALAAYNSGEGSVDRFGGVPPYKETQDYVRKVLDNEQSFLQDRRRMETAAKDQQESKKDLSWDEISNLFAKANKTKDPETWAQIRTAVNRRVNRSSGDRMFGLSPREYKRLYPLIAQTLKPEAPELAVASLGSGGLGG